MRVSNLARKFSVSLLAGLAVVVIATPSSGEMPSRLKTKAVLELFTSQGCSSCPPADAFLGTLQNREDVIALSLPVDYWDYLGWKDTLARPENTKRQRRYATTNGYGSVYTPQIVVNGVSHAVGSRPHEVENAIKLARKLLSARSVPMHVYMDKNDIVIEAGASQNSLKTKSATIWLAHVSSKETVNIGRGENNGRSITYYNVVRDMKKVGVWTGKATRISVSDHNFMPKGLEGLDTCVVLLQEGTDGAIIGAARLMMPNS